MLESILMFSLVFVSKGFEKRVRDLNTASAVSFQINIENVSSTIDLILGSNLGMGSCDAQFGNDWIMTQIETQIYQLTR